MNKELFKYYAAKNNDSMKNIAKVLNLVPQTISARINGRYGKFSYKEISILKERWKLKDDECNDIFLYICLSSS